MATSGLSRRQFLGHTGLFLGAAAVGAPLLAGCNRAAQQAATNKAGGGVSPLNMQLGWLLDNGQIGEAVAQAKGWYKDNGLDVTIHPGGPSIDGVALVAGGQSPVGQVSSSPSLMLARSQNVPIKAFAVGVQQHPYAFFSKPGKAVHEPRDLVGKKVGTQATGKVLLSALLAANNIDEKDVEVVVVGSDVTPLTTGQVDVWTGWVSNVAALRPLGPNPVIMRLWDTGIQLYANPYYATDSTLTQHKDQIEKFVAATAEGWKFAKDNLDQAVDMLVKMQPALKRDDMKAQAEVLLKYEFGPSTANDGWGTMDPKVWQHQLDMWDKLGQFKGKKPAVEDVMTTDILTATVGQRPKVG
jgi:NitT/TauT family transport system substrate-binding protein